MAYAQETGADNAVLLTQAELQLSAGEYEQARASLNRITESQPQHPQALKLLAELHYQKRDWTALMGLLPALRRAKNVPVEQLDDWTKRFIRNNFPTDSLDREQIEKLWQNLPRPLRKTSALIAARAKALAACGEQDQAQIEIRKALKASWDDELVKIYGELDLRTVTRNFAKPNPGCSRDPRTRHCFSQPAEPASAINSGVKPAVIWNPALPFGRRQPPTTSLAS